MVLSCFKKEKRGGPQIPILPQFKNKETLSYKFWKCQPRFQNPGIFQRLTLVQSVHLHLSRMQLFLKMCWHHHPSSHRGTEVRR